MNGSRSVKSSGIVPTVDVISVVRVSRSPISQIWFYLCAEGLPTQLPTLGHPGTALEITMATTKTSKKKAPKSPTNLPPSAKPGSGQPFPYAPPVYSPAASKQALEALGPDLAAIPDAEIGNLRMDVEAATYAALGVAGFVGAPEVKARFVAGRPGGGRPKKAPVNGAVAGGESEVDMTPAPEPVVSQPA